MIFKTTCNKLLLSILFLFAITVANAQTSLPYSTDFENGSDGWLGGGSGDSQRVTNNGSSPQGNDSWEIKDNSGTDSSFYQNFDLSGYSTVTISFSFESNSFDNSDDLFEVKLDNVTVLTYRYEQEWQSNGNVYNATIVLNANDYTFTNNSEIKFETDAGKSDKLYIDEISITGEKSSAPPTTCSTDAVTLPWTEGFEDTYNNSYTSDNSNIGNCWEYNQTNDGRVDFNQESHTGSKSALFYDDDRSTNDSAENLLTKTINLSNYTSATDLELSFWFADYGDENDGEDAVWIRGNDTADWIKIYDIRPEDFNNSQWNQITGLDIDQTLNDAGQTVSETFQIRIGQEENYEYNNDGIAFDDLQITGTIVEKPTLWKNDITTNDSHNFNPYTANDVSNKDITVSGIKRGNGIAGKGRNNMYNADGWDSTSFDADDYLEFTLTPTPSHEMNFESFVFNSVISSGDNITNIEVRTSLDNYTTSIGTVSANGATIDLSAQNFQAVSTPITFRIYAWGANAIDTELGIDNFAFYGSIAHYAYWNGNSWENNYSPSDSYKTVIADDYDTETQGSFTCIQLIINEGKKLSVKDNTYVEVENNVTVNGELVVETKGAFVQRDNNGVFINNGTSKVNKSTPNKAKWYYYTYWSSPVEDFNIESIFWSIGGKFYFDGRAWQYPTGRIMAPGQGFITRADDAGVQTATFTGKFNTGTITTPIVYDATNNVKYNLIGNPYPSSIDLDAFLIANNTIIEGAAYFWSQETPPVGGQFDASDYIPYNLTGSTSTSTDLTRIVNGFVPSAQSFFTISKAAGNVTFTNDMRMADPTSNSQFFKSSNNAPPKGLGSKAEKLWVNLSSSNGAFSQILVGYIDGATNEDDGLTYDATKFNEAAGAFLYSTIVNSDKKYVIQGKDVNSINVDEAIALGFKTTVATSYTISIAKLEGDFINGNTIYLKDNMLNIIHDLSANDYTFNSEVGEFNNRFEIVFKSIALSTNSFETETNDLKIVELNDNVIQFSVPNSTSISKVTVFDLLGKHIIDLKGTSSTEKYQFNSLTSSIYIAKVSLNDGVVITKKFIKK